MRISIFLFFILIGNAAHAQNFYLEVGAGYNFKMSAQNLEFFSFSDFTIATDDNVLEEQLFVSLGKGVSYAATAGYMFNEHLGAELQFSYLDGHENKAVNDNAGAIIRRKIFANTVRIIPSFLLTVDMGFVSPYAKFGPIFSKGTIFYQLTNERFDDSFKWELDGSFSVGLSSSAGARFNLNEKISLFSELNFISLSYGPSEGRLTEFIVDGEDEFNRLDVNEKEIRFVDTYSYFTDTQRDDSEANIQLKQKYPFSSIGLLFGVHFRL